MFATGLADVAVKKIGESISSNLTVDMVRGRPNRIEANKTRQTHPTKTPSQRQYGVLVDACRAYMRP